MTLTEEMRQAVLQSGDQPVYVEDPTTKTIYVLLAKAEYDRVKALLGTEDVPLEQTYAAQERIAHEQGWDDPAMSDYDDYELHKKSA